MAGFAIDTLKFADDLRSSGFTSEQASGMARAITDGLTSEVATKADIAALDAKFDSKFAVLEGKIDLAKAELRAHTASLVVSAVLFNTLALFGVAGGLYALLRSSLGAH